MPTFNNVTTVAGQQTWQSDDGRIKKFEVVLDVDGKHFKADTYSEKISQKGWKGDIETYEKADRNGVVRTYVKQPPKEGGYPNRGGGGGNRGADNPHTMYLSYAKDIAVALIETGKLEDGAVKFGEVFGEVVSEVIAKGDTLYNSRPGANPSGDASRPAETISAINDVFPGAVTANEGTDTVVEDIGEEPLSLSDLPNL